MSEKPAQTCYNCMFYLGKSDNGVCRQSPPQIVVVDRLSEYRSATFQQVAVTQFPEVSSTTWCGSFRTPVKEE